MAKRKVWFEAEITGKVSDAAPAETKRASSGTGAPGLFWLFVALAFAAYLANALGGVQ